MHRCRFIFIVTLCVPFANAQQAHAACEIHGGFHLTSAGPWPYTLATNAGETCGRGFRALGEFVFKRLYLLKPPQHGRVTLREGGTYAYAPASGYRGSDVFALRICGLERGHEGCAELQFTVTVH